MSEITPTPTPELTPTPTPAPTPSPEPTSWTSGLNDETKGWVQNRGFKDPGAVIDSYRNLEKLLKAPKERHLILPEKADDPAWNDIYSRMGRPQDPKDYDLKNIADEKFAEFSKKAFHELGFTKSQGEALAHKLKEYFETGAGERKQASEQKAVQDETDLKKEWGQAYESNINIAKRAASVFKIDADTIDRMESAMGYKKTMSLLQQIGSRLGEGKFVGAEGGGNSGALTPGAAKEQINRLMSDSTFVQKYTSGDAEAKEKMEMLHKMATTRI